MDIYRLTKFDEDADDRRGLDRGTDEYFRDRHMAQHIINGRNRADFKKIGRLRGWRHDTKLWSIETVEVNEDEYTYPCPL